MSEAQRSTETINVSEVRQEFATVLNSVFRNERRVLVEKSGIPVAAVVSVEDLRRLEQFEKREDACGRRRRADPSRPTPMAAARRKSTVRNRVDWIVSSSVVQFTESLRRTNRPAGEFLHFVRMTNWRGS